jgi:7-carboxy-7-deazaguanine synthase
MLISEIFHSIQGEGNLTGVPSVFVRTSGCNLRCKWCDTPYASWKPEGRKMEVDEIVAEVRKFKVEHVVLTGGEPMIAPGINDLADKLRAGGYHITIETAATVAPKGIACDLASLSPKLNNSTPEEGSIDATWIQRHEETRIPAEELVREWLENSGDYQFKFVISDEENLTTTLAYMRFSFPEVPRWKVQLMPEGTDAKTISERRAMLVDFCKESGYRLCDRLHIHLFGNTRGT